MKKDFSLTHVQYEEGSHVEFFLALVTLSPV
jgi:hypothetical protein